MRTIYLSLLMSTLIFSNVYAQEKSNDAKGQAKQKKADLKEKRKATCLKFRKERPKK